MVMGQRAASGGGSGLLTIIVGSAERPLEFVPWMETGYRSRFAGEPESWHASRAHCADEPLPTKPLLLVDVDGVISLFGFPQHARPAGRFEMVDGIAHFLSATRRRTPSSAGRRVRAGVVHRLGGEGERVPPPRARPRRARGRTCRSSAQLDRARARRATGSSTRSTPMCGTRPLAWIDDAPWRRVRGVGDTREAAARRRCS